MTPEVRQRSDRRKAPRGGRRQHDRPGFAPLVLVADEDPATSDVFEALLVTLRFAVARVDSVDKAAEVMSTSRMVPDVIVVRGRDVSPLLRAAWPSGVPVVTVTNGLTDDPALLVEAIRNAIRSAQRPRN